MEIDLLKARGGLTKDSTSHITYTLIGTTYVSFEHYYTGSSLLELMLLHLFPYVPLLEITKTGDEQSTHNYFPLFGNEFEILNA